MKKRRRDTVETIVTETDLCLTFHVTLLEEPRARGYAVGCPAFPGCWSEGETKGEALHNMALAIREYLALTDAEFSWAEA